LLVPWLGILLLLLLRANRSAQAWLIWLPLIAVLAIQIAARRVLDFLPSEVEFFFEVIGALAFGLAAVWLTSHSYGPRHRLLAFLGMLGILAGCGILTAAVRQTWDSGLQETLPIGILLGFCVLVSPIALSLAGLSCRRRYRPAALFLWVLVWLTAVSFVFAAPFLVFAMLVSGGEAPWGQFIGGILIVAAVCLGTLTPFLVLSFTSAFFKQRLQELLRLGGNEGPPVLTPVPIPAPE